MSTNCAKSCNTCKKPKAKRQTKELGPEEIKLLSSGFGEIQRAEGTEATKTLEYIAASIDYMKTEQVTSLPKVFRESCTNKQELCTFWAVIGKEGEKKKIVAKHITKKILTSNRVSLLFISRSVSLKSLLLLSFFVLCFRGM